MKPHFHIAGVPVQVHPFFFVTIVMLGAWGGTDWKRMAVWLPVVFASVLWHELGHALAFRAFNQQPSIVLHGMGGTTFGQQLLRPTQRIVVALAGPCAGFLAGSVVLSITRLAPQVESTWIAAQLVNDLLWANIAWGVFNLLPVLPMDGGLVTEALFDLRGSRRAHTWTLRISLAIAALIAAAALSVGQWWMAVLMLMFGIQHVVELRRGRSEFDLGATLRKARLRRSLAQSQPAPAPSNPAAGPDEPLDRAFVGALFLQSALPELAIPALEGAFRTDPTIANAQRLASALIDAGRTDEAQRLLAHPDLAGRSELEALRRRAG